MLESAWLFVGRIAFVWTLVVLLAAVYVDPTDTTGDSLATIGGVVGFVLWGVWTFGALHVEVAASSGTVEFVHPELTLLGIAMATIPGYIALTGPINIIRRAKNPEMGEI